MGLGTIATALSEDPGTIEEVYEPYLIKEGFLMRTPRGRVVTQMAYKHLGRDIPAWKARSLSNQPSRHIWDCTDRPVIFSSFRFRKNATAF